MRIPFLDKIPETIRNHFIVSTHHLISHQRHLRTTDISIQATTGEFVGTSLFLLLALSGAQVANTVPSSAGLTVADLGSNAQQLQYIAL
jgi:aquaporin related protein